MTTAAAFISNFWDDLVAHDRQYHFLVLIGFLGSFGFIRLSTRLMRSPRVPWWPGSVVSEGGLHVHHHVFGIVIMIVAGVTSFALSDVGFWYEFCALTFGIGMGLTIDEFALWLHLEDVYWAKEGRSSIDATLIAAAAMGLILLGAVPFEVHVEQVLDVILAVLVFFAMAGVLFVCFAKGRVFHGMIGLFIPFVALYAAVRLGKPSSPWARRFYKTRRPTKLAKAERRFRADRRTEQLMNAVRDAVGGTPTQEYEAKVGARRSEPPD